MNADFKDYKDWPDYDEEEDTFRRLLRKMMLTAGCFGAAFGFSMSAVVFYVIGKYFT